jgi:hypothetical protein
MYTGDLLDPSPTVYHSLGPIKANQSTNAGNISIVENIFRGQYSLSSDHRFEDWLCLVYGDQKTIARLRLIKARRAEETNPYQRFNHPRLSFSLLLPSPSLP